MIDSPPSPLPRFFIFPYLSSLLSSFLPFLIVPFFASCIFCLLYLSIFTVNQTLQPDRPVVAKDLKDHLVRDAEKEQNNIYTPVFIHIYIYIYIVYIPNCVPLHFDLYGFKSEDNTNNSSSNNSKSSNDIQQRYQQQQYQQQ